LFVGIFRISEELDAAVFEPRLFAWERTGVFVFFSQLPSDDLAGLHIWLIERIDPDDGSRDRRRDLPTEEFLTQVINIIDGNSNHGLSSLFQGGDFCILRGIRRLIESHT